MEVQPAGPKPASTHRSTGATSTTCPRRTSFACSTSSAPNCAPLSLPCRRSRSAIATNPASGSVRQVVGHLGDAERIFGLRAFCFSRGESQPLPGFDEGQYVTAAPYDTTSVASLLAELELLRNANLAAFRRFDADAWQRVGTAKWHPISVRALAYAIAGHARHHLAHPRSALRPDDLPLAGRVARRFGGPSRSSAGVGDGTSLRRRRTSLRMRSVEINGRRHSVDGPDEMPLLWVLRDLLGFTGTSTAAAPVSAAPVRSSRMAERCAAARCRWRRPRGTATSPSRRSTRTLRAARYGRHRIELDVAQCGYCQPGFLIAAADLIARRPQPTDAEIDGAFAAHLCRCGTYPRLRQAVRRAAETLRSTTVASGS